MSQWDAFKKGTLINDSFNLQIMNRQGMMNSPDREYAMAAFRQNDQLLTVLFFSGEI